LVLLRQFGNHPLIRLDNMPSLYLMRSGECDAEVVGEALACFGEGDGVGEGEVMGEDSG
jgi:hypothetical protein